INTTTRAIQCFRVIAIGYPPSCVLLIPVQAADYTMRSAVEQLRELPCRQALRSFFSYLDAPPGEILRNTKETGTR
ncbi:hypothetical protein ACFLTC_03225, partial [Chloroflexota bacterium]